MHRNAPWLLAIALPLLAGAQCRDMADDIVDDLDIGQKVAVEVFLIHVPDVGAEYGFEEMGDGEVTMVDVWAYMPLATSGEPKVTGATVRLLMPNGTPVELDELEPGHFRALSTDKPALYFEDRGEYQVVINQDDETWSATAPAYVETEITSPGNGSEVEQGQPLTVEVASPAEAVIAMVFDQEGNQVYDTLPTDAEGLLELVDGEGVQEVEIEGKALAEPGAYLMAIAGIEKADWREHSDNIYPALSVFASGSLDTLAVSTVPLDGMAGMVLAIQGDDLVEYGIEIEDQIETMLYGARLVLDQGLEEQPITAADAQISWGANSVDLTESAETEGLYEASTEDGAALAYHSGATYAFTLTDDEIYRLEMTAPEPPTISSPEPESYHDPSTRLELPCPADRDLCFAALLDNTGEMIWDDLPTEENADQIFTGQLGTPGGETITISSSYFSAAGQMYAVGLVGMNQLGDSGWSDSLNPEMVDMLIGTTSFTMVTTVQLP